MAEITPRPLAELTTLRTGAAPRRMIDAGTEDELTRALRKVWAERDDWFVLGGGSNLFVGDESFDGTVIRIFTQGIEQVEPAVPSRVRLRVQAGHSWDALVADTVAAGWAGLEAMSGIPGTVGAAPVQNIGAYGQEIRETLVAVDLLDERTGERSTVAAADLGLGFRTSVLKHHHGLAPRRPAVILSVTLELEDVGAAGRPVPPGQLRDALSIADDTPVPLPRIRDAVRRIRATKGMLLDGADLGIDTAADPDTRSAGSFFQNAIVPAAAAWALPADCPRWPLDDPGEAVRVIPLESYGGEVPPLAEGPAQVKVSTAWLIERAGIHKGFRLPGSRAAVSTKHALALTNRGGASAEEIAQLARYIQLRVQTEFGLLIEPEPVLIGVEL